ncbi:MAG: leucine-rich repeat domain-containing protein [Clostridia bacterium]|nr:leucine-rich repeat domain-containing protein [Clostridia bacterium]
MIIKKNVLMEISGDDIVDGTVIIPPNVTEIAPNVFSNYVTITHIEIPDSVKKIGHSAFSNCRDLKSVKLPKDLKELEFCTFDYCSSLKEIEIPDSVVTMNGELFSNCYSLEKIKLPRHLTRIPSYCFHNCYKLDNLVIPKSVKVIGESAFCNCTGLKNINIPNSLEDIGSEAFYNCSALERIRLPQEMNSIEDGAFRECKSLKYFVFPKGVSYISTNTFENCLSLEEIIFCGNIYDVEYAAFKNCYSLKTIELPETTNTISRYAFYNCTSLENLKTPPRLTCISEGSFQNCTSLQAFFIPVGVKDIADNAFSGCTALEQINIPSSVTTIGEDAFTDCSSLEKLQIPESVTSMKESENDNFLFFTKTKNGFTLSSEQEKESIPTENLNLDYAMLSKNWKYKNQLFKEQKNPTIRHFYETFLFTLTRDKIDAFIPNHNFTFFKQFNLKSDKLNIPNRHNLYVYKFLYNIGAFEPPVTDFVLDENNVLKESKTTDYAQKIVGFILEKLKKENINIYDFARRFSSMPVRGFKREFTEFFIKNYDELINENRNQPNFVSLCYEKFDEVQKANTSNRGSQRQLKPTVEKFRLFFAQDKFNGVTDESSLIAKTISPYFFEQKDFDKAIKIDNERIKKKVRNNILKEPLAESDVFANIDEYQGKIIKSNGQIIKNLAEISDTEFTFEWLEKNDPQNFILGKLCSCCSHLDGVGYSIMHASIVHPYIQNLVIKNEKGEIVAKSTLYINHKKRYGVCNNVEVKNGIHGKDLDIIYEKFRLGINAFAVKYNKENPRRPLKQINVGMHLNDISNELERHGHQSTKVLPAINYKKYGLPKQAYNGDSSNEQYAVWINPDLKKQKEK